MEVRIRSGEGQEFQPDLLWDTQWDTINAYGDWVVSGPLEQGNPSGLRSDHTLDTAVLLCLFTDVRADPSDLIPGLQSDPKGWWGDTVDLQGFETPLGSKLWLLNRSVLNDQVAALAVLYAQQALQVLITQGMVATVTITSQMDKVRGLLGLTISLFSQNGTLIYKQQFASLWQQESV